MAIQPDPTPKHDMEWLLSGLLPGAAEAVLDADIARLERHIRKLQVNLAQVHRFRKDLVNGDWPKDDDGFLTQSADNPL
jgi:hypothetical protein